MNKYRTPTIEELMTDGFEYEVKTRTKGESLGRMTFLNSDLEDIERFAEEDIWKPRVKRTLSGPGTSKEEDGTTYNWTYLDEWDNPYQQRDYLQMQLDKGLIRCKI